MSGLSLRRQVGLAAVGALLLALLLPVTAQAAAAGPSFVYPKNGQILDYEGAYLFKVNPVAHASGYLWGFFQNGNMIWENNRDEHKLSGTEYGIHPGTPAHGRFAKGDADVWVRGLVHGKWTEATIIKIHLLQANGCSTYLKLKNFTYRDDFRPACNQHDWCYINNGGPGKPAGAKTECDNAFLMRMQQICRTKPKVESIKCLIWAGTYWRAVQIAGGYWFYNADPATRAGPPSFGIGI